MAWCAASLRAAVPDAFVTEDAEFDQHYLLGDWIGARTKLWEHGVKPKFLLISDAYGNPYAGKEQGFTSYSMFCADLKLDTEKLAIFPAGSSTLPLRSTSATNSRRVWLATCFPSNHPTSPRPDRASPT